MTPPPSTSTGRSITRAGRHKTATERQLNEAIVHNRDEVLMNSKTEFGSNFDVINRVEFRKNWEKREERGAEEEETAISFSPRRKRKKKEEAPGRISIQMEGVQERQTGRVLVQEDASFRNRKSRQEERENNI